MKTARKLLVQSAAAVDGDLAGRQPDSFDIRTWAGKDTESDPVHKAKNDLAGKNIVVHKK